MPPRKAWTMLERLLMYTENPSGYIGHVREILKVISVGVIMGVCVATCLNWSEVALSCPTLCDPMGYSLPGSSVHGILQARILEWVAIAFSRRSSQPRDWTRVSHIVGRCFSVWATREDQKWVKHMIYVENSSRHGNTRPPSLSPEKPVGRTRSNSCIPVVDLFWYLAKLIQFVKFKNKIKLKKKKRSNS